MAEKVMIELVSHGIGRWISRNTQVSIFRGNRKGRRVDRCLRQTPAIAAAFGAEELEAMFDPANALGFLVRLWMRLLS